MLKGVHQAEMKKANQISNMNTNENIQHMCKGKDIIKYIIL